MSWIQGFQIPFVSPPNQKAHGAVQPKFSTKEKLQLHAEIDHLISQGAVRACAPCKGQFISPYFLVDKSNGKKRFVLNLKGLNKFINPPHFKMEDGRTVIKLINKDCYLTKIDLKDAYFAVPIDIKFRKYLRFQFDGVLYEFLALPFGLSYAPYLFTKLVRPILAYYRSKGITCVAYIDDWILIHDSVSSATRDTTFVCHTLQQLGFVINSEKSCLTPQKKCLFLGFLYDTQKMILELPDDKREKIRNTIVKLKNSTVCKIRFMAHVAGLLVSACPAVKYGKLYTKIIEREKFLALKRTNGDYDQSVLISNELKSELAWWESNVFLLYNDISPGASHLEIYTDASKTGWGAVCEGRATHGWWNNQEAKLHINILELKAIFFALKCFVGNLTSINILLRVDNTTAISYVNRMGSVQHLLLNSIAREMWQWCEARNIWIFASYVKSEENKADKDSRILSAETEWELADFAFKNIVMVFGKPEIDLFASRANSKCSRYISWFKDPGSEAVDAFTISWRNLKFYAFPPFSLVLRVLNKIVLDKADGVIVVPDWHSQPWYPLFLKLLVGKPVLFKPDRNLLCCPFRSQHPLASSLTLVAARLSAKRLD